MWTPRTEVEKYVHKLVQMMKEAGLDMEYFPSDDEMVEMWQYNGNVNCSRFSERELYITITWNNSNFFIYIDKDNNSYSFGGFSCWLDTTEFDQIRSLINE